MPLVASAAVAAETGNLSLEDAAKLGDRAAVQSLLSGRADVNLPEADGTTALMWAAYRNDVETADLLLHAGADVKAANQYGATALYAAAASTDSAMAEKLLAAGADANAHLLSGETPLMEAARRGNLTTVHLLLASGADPNASEANGGQDALMWGAAQRHAAVIDELVRHGADVNARSKGGFTALMFAAQQGDAESIRVLLGAEANPNDVAPTTKVTALLAASAMGRTKAATVLLDGGAEPNVADATGYTPLHYAARRKGAVGIITALLAHGAKPDVRLNEKNPTYFVSGVALQGATAVALAAEINNLDAIKALVAGGADPLIPTAQGTTPLMLAAGGGTDVAGARSLEERATAVQTVKFLVEHGADVNAAGQFGWTALHTAAYQGLNDVIAYLASKGAKLDTMDGFGQTPLSISNAIVTRDLGKAYYQTARSFKRETSELLLRLGATPLDRSGVVVVGQRATQ